MKKDKPADPDALEKQMKRLIRKIENENDALHKILKNSGEKKRSLIKKPKL